MGNEGSLEILYYERQTSETRALNKKANLMQMQKVTKEERSFVNSQSFYILLPIKKELHAQNQLDSLYIYIYIYIYSFWMNKKN